MLLSASALRAAFRRSGAGGSRTREIESAPEELAAVIRETLGAIRDGDQPVLIWSENVDDWIAVAPTELYVHRGGRLARLAVDQMIEVAPMGLKTDSAELEA